MNLRVVLISMGYREEQPGKWLKPIGFHLFTYEEDRQEWSNWCKGANGKLLLWEKRKFDPVLHPNPLYTLKEAEAFTRISVGNGDSEFQLSALDL